jgi:hypothetical protein
MITQCYLENIMVRDDLDGLGVEEKDSVRFISYRNRLLRRDPFKGKLLRCDYTEEPSSCTLDSFPTS